MGRKTVMQNLLFRLVVCILAKKLNKQQLTYIHDICESRLTKLKRIMDRKERKDEKNKFNHIDSPTGLHGV